MPLPWKKSKSGRISRLVSDLQQSPKHGGSLVVETGFPTSLIHLFFKNRDRLKKSCSKRNKTPQTQQQTVSLPTRQRVSSVPPPSLPREHDPPSVTEDRTALTVSRSEDSFVTSENKNYGEDKDGGHGGNHGGGGCCVLMVVVVKVFLVAVLALSTKKLAVGITISAFALLFLELVVARVFTYLNLCPDAQVRLDSLIRKIIGKKREEKLQSPPPPPPSSSSSSTTTTPNKVSFEIIESFQDSRDCIEEAPQAPAAEEREPEAILTKEKSKSAKLKSKIVKKIVPKKLRSYKKKKKLKKMREKEGVEVEITEEEESMTEGSSLYSEDITESEISERDEINSNPPLLESCEEEEEGGSKGDLTKAIVMIVIALGGLLGGKVLAIVLTVSCCLILRFVFCKSQTSF